MSNPLQVLKGKAKLIRGAGDLVHIVVKPIAVALGSDCIDKETNTLKPESPCGKRRDDWNDKLSFQ